MSRLPWTSTRVKRPIYAAAGWLPLLTVAVLSGCATTSELATVKQIPSLMQAFEVDGLAVTAVAGDKVLVSAGFGVATDGDAFTSTSSCGLYSATKVLASLTYARLAQDGRIDLNAPLGEYLEDAPDDWRGIPFYRLLNHTSGITMAVNKPAFGKLGQTRLRGTKTSSMRHPLITRPASSLATDSQVTPWASGF